MPQPMEKFQSSTIICSGGLDSNQNWLQLNQTNTGVAAELINYEPSLFGGYRRIDGFTVLEDTDSGAVDPSGAEEKILGVFIYDNQILAARKQQSGATYEFYKYTSGASWTKYSTGLTFTSTNVDTIRYATFNFDGTEKIIFVDGVNNATLFDGTDWINIDPSATGADYANSGGAQALSAPNYVKIFRNHIFMAKCTGACNIIAHSAPNAEYDWTSASGAGQLNANIDIKQIHPYRDELFVFGEKRIRKIVVDSSANFTLQDVTTDVGLRASDSVIEINGDLIFLSHDGLRPVKATERIDDTELSSLSKRIQQDITDLLYTYDPDNVRGVLIQRKTQFRLFFSDSTIAEESSFGILGGLKAYSDSPTWEFSKTKGIRVSCVTSGYFGSPSSEYVIHGGFDGKVYRQEVGNSFNGANIFAQYSTPYIDFGAPSIRKTPNKITVFTRPEGDVTLQTAINYDWGSEAATNPASYTADSEGGPSVYGTAVYGTGTYGGATVPTLLTNVQGSGNSMQITFTTNGQDASYSIQGIVVEYTINGFK